MLERWAGATNLPFYSDYSTEKILLYNNSHFLLINTIDICTNWRKGVKYIWIYLKYSLLKTEKVYYIGDRITIY
jgi:hypothetical protein